jgi:uncharacterized membrane protein YeaQ/YmgE (transglycosylase-associated protein family)
MIITSMSLTGWIILLVIAGVCGSIGESIAGYSHGGCLTSIALGFTGGMLGVWLAHAVHLPNVFAISVGGSEFPVLWSIVGSALFVAVIAAFRRMA